MMFGICNHIPCPSVYEANESRSRRCSPARLSASPFLLKMNPEMTKNTQTMAHPKLNSRIKGKCRRL